ncbi:hypothetical protein FRC05_010256 [Tulasnella sp. 425]|nr:hypothetical protein FRC05_010256 [Tulasnella sp. 425]
MSGRPPSPPPDSGWSSIRPYTPRLFLTIWEISSVSVTLVLTTTLDTTFVKRPPNTPHGAPSLHEDTQDGDSWAVAEDDTDTKRGISNILRSGMAVNINGNPWNKVIMHTGEDDAEAILTIYGLLPAMQYDIDLVVASADEAYRGVIVTAGEEGGGPTNSTPTSPQQEQGAQPMPATFQPITPESTPPSSPVRRSPTPPPVTSPGMMSVEERVAQLKATLASTVTERDAMAAQLRQARKDSQRIENQMRSEIEALKRTGEKHAATELRSSRKILAAQKAVSQLTLASEDAESQLTELADNLLPSLGERTDRVTDEHARVKDEADRSAVETEEALRADRKRAEDLDAELADAEGQLDGVNKRKEALEDDRIPELEKELEALTKELETIDKGSSVKLPIEFNHEVDYPHHYQTPPIPHPGSFHPYRNPGQRNNPLAPIQRPPGQGPMNHFPGANPSFSSSQRSLDGPDPGVRGPGPNFYPAGGPAPFPQMRHPSVTAHPAPRGLFSNANHPSGAGIQRPMHTGGRRRVSSNRSGDLPSSSSSLNTGVRGPNSQMDVFGSSSMGGPGGAAGSPAHLPTSVGLPPFPPPAGTLGVGPMAKSATSLNQISAPSPPGPPNSQPPNSDGTQDAAPPTKVEPAES